MCEKKEQSKAIYTSQQFSLSHEIFFTDERLKNEIKNIYVGAIFFSYYIYHLSNQLSFDAVHFNNSNSKQTQELNWELVLKF